MLRESNQGQSKGTHLENQMPKAPGREQSLNSRSLNLVSYSDASAWAIQTYQRRERIPKAHHEISTRSSVPADPSVRAAGIAKICTYRHPIVPGSVYSAGRQDPRITEARRDLFFAQELGHVCDVWIVVVVLVNECQ